MLPWTVVCFAEVWARLPLVPSADDGTLYAFGCGGVFNLGQCTIPWDLKGRSPFWKVVWHCVLFGVPTVSRLPFVVGLHCL